MKLYRMDGGDRRYWETWEADDGSHLVHSGVLGTQGESKIVRSSFFRRATSKIQREIHEVVAQGFRPIEEEDHAALVIEYRIDGMGTEEDLERRHRLEAKLNELLGWTGLGACDGGSTGSGTMEVCSFVVDFDLAKRVIEAALVGTEFQDYTRIYDEGA